MQADRIVLGKKTMEDVKEDYPDTLMLVVEKVGEKMGPHADAVPIGQQGH